MATERTLSIVKPDAVRGNKIGAIIARFEQEGLRIAAAKKIQLDRREAEGFYAEHSARGFFGVELSQSGQPPSLAELEQAYIARLLELTGGNKTQVARLLGVGCAETVRKWVRQAEIDGGTRPGVSTDESAELKRLKRENAELKRANAILKTASAFFAAELDRPRH